MKNYRLLLSLFAIVGIMCTVSCQEDPKENIDNSKTSLTFEKNGIELEGKAGSYRLKYTLKNGIEGIDIAAESNAEWLTIRGTEDSHLLFDYEQNLDSKDRIATILVTYPNLPSTVLRVKQLIDSSVTFTIEISESTTTGCTTKITPSDDDILYIPYIAEVAYLNGKFIETKEELFQDDYEYFMGIAESVNAPKLKEFFLANYFAYQGEESIQWGPMLPGTDYVVYVYAVEFNAENNDYKMVSPITYQMVNLDGPELREIEFNVEFNINGPSVEYNIAPVNYSGKYYLTIHAEEEFMYRDANDPVDEYYSQLVSDTWVSTVNTLIMSGYSASDLLEIMCLEGDQTYEETLNGSTNYSLVIYAVEDIDGLPQVVSIPQVKNFRTGEVGPSDMTFDIKVENNYVRVADITITPSKNEPYTAAIIVKENVPELENSELIAWLNKNLNMDTYRKEVHSHLNNLAPETEYSILVYGYWGGVVTTDLFRVDFKTEAESECENSIIRVDYNGPYSLSELEAYDPYLYYNHSMFEYMGWYAMWAEVFTEQPTKDMFCNVYRADYYITANQNDIFADLVSITCDQTQLLTCEGNTLYVMCAVAMDYRGNYSEMWVSEPFKYSYSAATKRPLSELIEKIHGTTATPAETKATRKGITNLLVK